MEVEPLQLLPALLSMALYARRAQTLRGTPRAVPSWRQWCFHGGALVVALTLSSPLGALADELFWAHMVEHLVIVDLGALLLVLGLTGPVLAPVLRVPALAPLRVLGHPLVALPLWAVNLGLWHVPVLHEAAVEHDAVHALQHLLFLATGGAVWLALLGPLPKPAWFGNGWRLGYIVGVRLAGAVLANVLLFGGGPFYDVYAAGEASHGLDPQDDQAIAAGIMMVEESVLTICLFCWLFLKAAREGEERQELLDLARARGVELTDQRAARAVAAGRGAELRRRLEDEHETSATRA
ncbi:cytochrome c oxidase assembly protein [Conexibacter sp. SYSU D00693]|uniref:cytochrome c oxidase assembly protein n=1 Tax=Conexibacter sp. SYSU D00693 TaxID=2812560 RepID=UPI00196A221C|nr:cytochrome c oxidase assembly protein [Conexibacter sp. SYSU D00693]